MTKNELKRGYKFIETFEGKVNVLVIADGTFHGWKHHGKDERIVAFDHIPTQDEVKDWVIDNIFKYCMYMSDWTDLTFSYFVLDSNELNNQIKIK